jgi:hypothetical protein
MQIHEVTIRENKAWDATKNAAKKGWNVVKDITKNAAGAFGDELDTLAFGSPVSGSVPKLPDELQKKVDAMRKGGPALTAQELKQVNDYLVSIGEKPITAADLARPAATNQPPLATSSTAPAPSKITYKNITAPAKQADYVQKPMSYKTGNVPPGAIPQVKTTPKVNPAAAPVPYMFNGRKLDPNNVKDAQIIATLQAAGVTSGYLK